MIELDASKWAGNKGECDGLHENEEKRKSPAQRARAIKRSLLPDILNSAVELLRKERDRMNHVAANGEVETTISSLEPENALVLKYQPRPEVGVA